MTPITPRGADGLRPPAPRAALPYGVPHRASNIPVVGTPVNLDRAVRGSFPAVNVVIFDVPGEPVAKARPRVTRKGQTYTPRTTVDAESQIGWAFRSALCVGWSTRGRYRVSADFYLHTGHRRDVDNLLKTVLDGLNGVAYDDDVQVVEIAATVHRRAETAGSRIEVQLFEEA